MKTRQWPKRKLIKYSFIFLFLFFLLMELVFRIVFYIQYKGYHTSVYIQGNTLQAADTVAVFKNRPFYLDYNKRFQFNEEGMKAEPGDVFMPEKKENDFWVFLFGGSAMEGSGSVKTGEWFAITGQEDYSPAETIGGYLQQVLQEKMPGKKVKVFNAANTSFTVWQSFLRYNYLSVKYKMDWVVSMDAQNDPPVLAKDETTMEYLKKDWAAYPVFKFPLQYIIPLTSHSAFINKIKQGLYHVKSTYYKRRNEENNFPARTKWASVAANPPEYAAYSEDIRRAVESFKNKLFEFDSLLRARNQKHLLLVQPQISFRDTAGISYTEKALYNYYCNEASSPGYNTFISKIYETVAAATDSVHKNIVLMDAVNHWKGQVFVDYCHLTKEVNKRIAGEIAKYILSNGTKKIFISK